ncbi:MAG: ABC transporter permease [Cyclobacteriaceae bacterium]|nr:ABC transporter permease [Cyclobacteriaceae bacterium]
MGNKWFFNLLYFLFSLPLWMLPFFWMAADWPFPNLFPTTYTVRSLAGIPGLGQSIGLSLAISLSGALISTLTGFILSKEVAYHRHHHHFLLIGYLPLLLSPVLYAMSLFYFFIMFGLDATVVGIMLGQQLILLPYAFILCMGHWTDTFANYLQLTENYGANRIQKVRYLLFPMSKKLLFLCLFQTFLISWFDFAITSYIGVGQVKTLTVLVYQYLLEADYYFAAGISALIIYPPVLLLIFNRLLAKGLAFLRTELPST